MYKLLRASQAHLFPRVRPSGLGGQKSGDDTLPFFLPLALASPPSSGSNTEPWLELDLLADLDELELLAPASTDTPLASAAPAAAACWWRSVCTWIGRIWVPSEVPFPQRLSAAATIQSMQVQVSSTTYPTILFILTASDHWKFMQSIRLQCVPEGRTNMLDQRKHETWWCACHSVSVSSRWGWVCRRWLHCPILPSADTRWKSCKTRKEKIDSCTACLSSDLLITAENQHDTFPTKRKIQIRQ